MGSYATEASWSITTNCQFCNIFLKGPSHSSFCIIQKNPGRILPGFIRIMQKLDWSSRITPTQDNELLRRTISNNLSLYTNCVFFRSFREGFIKCFSCCCQRKKNRQHDIQLLTSANSSTTLTTSGVITSTSGVITSTSGTSGYVACVSHHASSKIN